MYIDYCFNFSAPGRRKRRGQVGITKPKEGRTQEQVKKADLRSQQRRRKTIIDNIRDYCKDFPNFEHVVILKNRNNTYFSTSGAYQAHINTKEPIPTSGLRIKDSKSRTTISTSGVNVNIPDTIAQLSPTTANQSDFLPPPSTPNITVQ
ncbi:unnamed protein product, partial [Owenia fusiformis]